MAPSVVYKLIDECAAHKIEEIGFFVSGEPLLIDALPEYIKYAKDQEIQHTFITTNGEYLVPDKFIPLVEAGLDGIKISVAGGNRERYKAMHNVDNFDIVIAHIKRFGEYLKENKLTKPKTAIGTIVCDGDTQDVDLLTTLLGTYVDEIYALPLFGQVGVTAGIKGNPGRYKKNMAGVVPCWCLFNMAIVRWDGKFEICGYGYDDTFVVPGNTLAEAWHSDKMVAIRQQHLDNSIIFDTCRKCLGL
jgi:hypothetical protein